MSDDSDQEEPSHPVGGGGSVSESVPPSPSAQVHNADQISKHPLWQRSAGIGRHPPYPSANGKKNGKEKPPASPMQDSSGSRSRMCPISMLELEIKARNVLDGASSVASDAGYDEQDLSTGRRRKQKHNNNEDESNSDSDGSVDEDQPAKKKKTPGSTNERALLVRAAFGGGASSQDRILEDSANSETADNSSVMSVRRDAQFGPARAFPVTGISCVGCALPQRIGPVDDFVHASCSKMNEVALFKLAALVYMDQVVKPAKAEGIVSPDWSWKDVRSHYTMHCVDVRMQRYENLRVLAAMRKTIELNLLKEDPETGEQTLDKQNSSQILQIMDRQNKILDLITSDSASKANKKSGVPS